MTDESTETDDEPGAEDDVDVDVEMNEDAIEGERERRTIELEVPVDNFHASARETLEERGVDVKTSLERRLQRTVEDELHEILQTAKYSE